MPMVDHEHDSLDRGPDGWWRAYHGTGASHIRRFLPLWGDIGPHFGTPLAANRRADRSFVYPPFNPVLQRSARYSPDSEPEWLKTAYMNGVVFPVDLNISNPLRVSDHCGVVPNFMNWYPSSVAQRSSIGDPSIMRSAEQRENYDWARRLFIEAAEALGYDGIVYANDVEGRGGDSLIPFRQEQIRFPFQAPMSGAE
jgi:hypothetical protein